MSYDASALQGVIETNVERIEGIIRRCSTHSTILHCMLEERRPFPHPNLSSPARQIRFLLGLLLMSEEPSEDETFSKQHWDATVGPLQELFHAYLRLFSPDDGDPFSQSEQWLHTRKVAMSAFLDYSQKGLLASVDQIVGRISLYLTPFDGQLLTNLGITATDAVSIGLWISDVCDRQIIASRPVGPGSTDEWSKLFANLGRINLLELKEQFGDKADLFWDQFTIARGDGEPIKYPTEQSVIERRPLIRSSDNDAILINLNLLFNAILLAGETCLVNGPIRDKYFSTRDDTLEHQAAETFARMLGPQAKVYRSLFETEDLQYEHDSVVVTPDVCLFLEVKASPPTEPFRDPDRAITRLKHNFRADTGIQAAYQQSLRLMQAIRQGGLTLFNRRGEKALSLPSSIQANCFCVCITRDSFGPLATYLSLLLEKDVADPYPWVVNIWDLENVSEAWKYFQWDGRQLKNFLSMRIQLHDKAYSDDELDYVGAYMRHCGLRTIVEADTDFVQLDPTYSSIVDDIYTHLHQGGKRVSINPVYPVHLNLRKSLMANTTVFEDTVPTGPIMIGRNEPCPCSSGVKFKKCHGK